MGRRLHQIEGKLMINLSFDLVTTEEWEALKEVCPEVVEWLSDNKEECGDALHERLVFNWLVIRALAAEGRTTVPMLGGVWALMEEYVYGGVMFYDSPLAALKAIKKPVSANGAQ